jgi:hypothetical protein
MPRIDKGKECEMKRFVVLLSLVLLAAGIPGCGESGVPGDRANSAHVNVATIDDDTPSDSHHDKDDNPIDDFGKPAVRLVQEAVTLSVKRYYAAAAAEDGYKGCTMLFSLLAESVVPDFGEESGTSALRGKTCGAVLSKIFKQGHRKFVAENATLRVIGVRVMGKRGYALLKTGTYQSGSILLRRERTVWKIGEFGGSGAG